MDPRVWHRPRQPVRRGSAAWGGDVAWWLVDL